MLSLFASAAISAASVLSVVPPLADDPTTVIDLLIVLLTLAKILLGLGG